MTVDYYAIVICVARKDLYKSVQQIRSVNLPPAPMDTSSPLILSPLSFPFHVPLSSFSISSLFLSLPLSFSIYFCLSVLCFALYLSHSMAPPFSLPLTFIFLSRTFSLYPLYSLIIRTGISQPVASSLYCSVSAASPTGSSLSNYGSD